MTLLLAVFCHPVQAASFQIDHPRIALGEPLTLTLDATSGVLETLDLKPLAADFEIHGRTLNRSESSEQLTLTLYPLRTGKLTLPALGLPGRAPSVEVLSESENVPKIRFSLSSDPAIPHVRQAVRLTLEVCDDGSLEWKRPQLPTREGVHLRALGEQQVDVELDGERCTAHRWHWGMLATAAGALDLPLPMLEAGKFGQRLRFPPPAATLVAAAVPAWLPAEAAVGKPVIAAGPLPANWALDRPLAWRIEIAGGYSQSALKTLLALQLVGHPRLQVYPPSVEALPPKTAEDVTPRHAVTLYAVPDRTGALVFPELALPWFDPANGHLQTLSLPGRQVTIDNPLHAKLKWAALAAASLIVLLVVARQAWRALRWRIARRRSLGVIGRAGNLVELLAGVRAFSLDAKPCDARTLGQWRTTQTPAWQTLDALITALDAAAYGAQQADVGALKQQALQVLRQIKPKAKAV